MSDACGREAIDVLEVVVEIENTDTTVELHGTRRGVETLLRSVQFTATPQAGPTVQLTIPIELDDIQSLRVVSVIGGNVETEFMLTEPFVGA